MTNNQWQGGPQQGAGQPYQQPQPGHGQPPQHGWGQPPQHGYGQPPQHGYGQPPQPQKKKPSPVLIALIAVLVLAIGGGGVYLYLSRNKDEPNATPSSTQSQSPEDSGKDRTSEEPAKQQSSAQPGSDVSPDTDATFDSDPTTSSDGGSGSNAPEWPTAFGDYAKDDSSQSSDIAVAYLHTSQAGTAFGASFIPNVPVTGTEDYLEDVKTDGDTTCGIASTGGNWATCLTDIHGGLLTTTMYSGSSTASVDDLLAATKEFVSAWQ